jgi:thiol-disulfide isomerase/thioredoxin
MKRIRTGLLPLIMVILTGIALLSLLPGCAKPSDANTEGAGNTASETEQPSAGNTSPLAEPVREGSAAPDFSYTTVDGTSSKLSAHRGSVVLINLWASWCGPCIVEMPDIGQLKQQNPELVVLAVNVSDDPTDARNYISEAGYDFTWILDESGKIGSLYPTDGIPYTIVVDKEGTVSSIFLGSPRDPLETYGEAINQAGI